MAASGLLISSQPIQPEHPIQKLVCRMDFEFEQHCPMCFELLSFERARLLIFIMPGYAGSVQSRNGTLTELFTNFRNLTHFFTNF